MKKLFRIILCLIGIMVIICGTVVAHEEDILESKDHPIISRYGGSIIVGYEYTRFDEYLLIVGDINSLGRPTESQLLQGVVTRIRYRAPRDTSTLELYLNYEKALKESGFEILYSGKGSVLGSNDIPRILWGNLSSECQDLYGEEKNQRYLAAKLITPAGDIYVSIFMAKGIYEYPMMQLDVIEVKPAKTGQVFVNSAILADSIAKMGHVAIYSIYFDTGKAEIKSESEPTLEEIANFLMENKDMDLYVIGHTDNVGSLDFNMELSQRRAEAVVETLVSKYKVSKKRLHPIGIGPVSPVDSNRTEEGRGKNRRVELVER